MKRTCTYEDDQGTVLTDGALLLYAIWMPTSGPFFYHGHVDLKRQRVTRKTGTERLDDLMACCVVDWIPESQADQEAILKTGIEEFLCKRWNCTVEDLYKHAK